MNSRSMPAPALRYYGGKFRLARWIIANFPPHDCYVEPFGGAAGVLLQKPLSYIDVYNDLDRDVVTFFKVLRDRPEELVRAIKLTPYAREEYQISHEPTDDELEQARRVYVRCWQGFGAKQTRSGWSYQLSRSRGMPLRSNWGRTEHLYLIAERLRCVQIEHEDAFEVIGRYDSPTTLFYVDPPYLAGVRGHSRSYAYEMKDDEHVRLAEKMHAVRGMVIISGYQSELYESLYADWDKRSCRTNNMRRKSILEFIWVSPNAQKHEPMLIVEKRE